MAQAGTELRAIVATVMVPVPTTGTTTSVTVGQPEVPTVAWESLMEPPRRTSPFTESMNVLTGLTAPATGRGGD